MEQRGVMVLSNQEGLMPDENKCRRHVPWTQESPLESFYSVLGPDR